MNNTKRFEATISVAQFKKLKSKAKKEGVSMREIVRRALKKELNAAPR